MGWNSFLCATTVKRNMYVHNMLRANSFTPISVLNVSNATGKRNTVAASTRQVYIY